VETLKLEVLSTLQTLFMSSWSCCELENNLDISCISFLSRNLTSWRIIGLANGKRSPSVKNSWHFLGRLVGLIIYLFMLEKATMTECHVRTGFRIEKVLSRISPYIYSGCFLA